jgi:hypothetical protein
VAAESVLVVIAVDLVVVVDLKLYRQAIAGTRATTGLAVTREDHRILDLKVLTVSFGTESFGTDNDTTRK